MNRPTIERLMEALGDILSEKHGADIRFSVHKKEDFTNERADGRDDG